MIKRHIYIFGFWLFLLGLFLQVGKAEAAGPCLCVDMNLGPVCIPAATELECLKTPNPGCPSGVMTWEKDAATCDSVVKNKSYGPGTGPTAGSTQGTKAKSTLSDLITQCGENPMPSQCWDVTVFISLALQIVQYMFGIIGSIALLFFVYGGFVFILSQGNPEQIGHGKAILVSAVLGIVIAFSGYAIVKFVGTVVGIKSDYTLF